MSTILLLIAILAADHIEATDPTCTKKLDILIGVDASSSVCGLATPCPNWEYMLQCIVNIVNSLTIGRNDTRVAFAKASSTIEILWNWNRYADKDALLSAIGKVEYKGGELINLLSFGLIFSGILKKELGDRADVPNVMIGFTDGVPLNIVEIAAVMKDFQSTGARVIIVCLPGCSESFARSIATEPKQANADYFMVDNFSSLGTDSFSENLLKEICAA